MKPVVVIVAIASALATTQPALAQERTLVLAVGGEPDTGFDPVMGWGRYGNPLFQATLLRRDTDLALAGDLATSWELSEDRLTWRIALREDARFSDGTALTAEDVAFTFNTARDAGGLADLSVLESARATGPQAVELHLREPRITFVSHLVSLGIVPAASYAARGRAARRRAESPLARRRHPLRAHQLRLRRGGDEPLACADRGGASGGGTPGAG
jgi:peptide/nickel transport system substrate-binding protein